MSDPHSPVPPALQKIGNALERFTEAFLFSSRWLLAPFYLGLAFALVVLLIKFMEEFFHLAVHAFSATEAQVILGVLSLVDLALTGSLLVIVIYSGYENFVSKIDHSKHEDWPTWMGTIDFTALKLKLLSSIVAISAIQLLKQFMAVKELAAKDPVLADRTLFWYVVIHLVFVGSSVLLALSDRIAGGHEPQSGSHNSKPKSEAKAEAKAEAVHPPAGGETQAEKS